MDKSGATRALLMTVLRLAHLFWALYIGVRLWLLSVNYSLRSVRKDDQVLQANRVPNHIALCFSNEILHPQSIKDLVRWSKALGITNITLYDDRGRLKHMIDDLQGVHILSRADGRQRFVKEIVRDLCQLPDDQINVDCVARRVYDIYKAPDPDLLITFGPNTCLHGFPPWQLRLTEIFSLPTHHYLPLDEFLQCLHRFSKVEQRIGA